ncbi:MAG: hypothetical protein V2A79_11570 [Planctomycetota bacterium]
MIARFSGATLGLLAFSVAVLGGLWVGDPATVILSRAIWSLVVFCVLGLVLGTAAQAVVAEYARRRFDALRRDLGTGTRPPEAPDKAGDNGAVEAQKTG